MSTLSEIKKHNLIFISAQPDTPYFHWQVEIYMRQFKLLGLQPYCYSVFGYSKKPSKTIQKLKKQGFNIAWYKDERQNKIYIPSIRPFLLAKFFKDNPMLGQNVFYHDSDILFYQLPKFELLLQDDICYVSDTVSYIGADYIKSCETRYRSKYPDIKNEELLDMMCDIVNVDKDLVIKNEKNSGGAQYLLKNIDSDYWNTIETNCVKLYSKLIEFENKYPIDHHIQKWTTDMWNVLWELWKRGKQTIVHKELSFSWCTSPYYDVYRHNIFHLAGITDDVKYTSFYKGEYVNINILSEYDLDYFDYVCSDNATSYYVEWINKVKQDYYNKKPNSDVKKIQLVQKASIQQDTKYDSYIYKQIVSKTLNDKSYYIDLYKETFIGWNGTRWVLDNVSKLNNILKNKTNDFTGICFSLNTDTDIFTTEWEEYIVIEI